MGATILVTGATGFLGGAVAAQLLQRPGIGRVLLLVRGVTPTAALERAKAHTWEASARALLACFDDLDPGRALGTTA